MSSAPKYFGCYLLRSLVATSKTYIGFTLNPMRRIRQHNREIKGGARKTKRFAPWQMLVYVHGFPDQVSALQFEWAWQHPLRSRRVRAALVDATGNVPKFRNGTAGQVQLLCELLSITPWSQYALSVHIVDENLIAHFADCRPLPAHMQFACGALALLPHYQRATHAELDALEAAKFKASIGSGTALAATYFVGGDSDSDSESDSDTDKLEIIYPHLEDDVYNEAAGVFEYALFDDQDHELTCALLKSRQIADIVRNICSLCTSSRTTMRTVFCAQCRSSTHLVCLAALIHSGEAGAHTRLVPDASAHVVWPCCNSSEYWADVVRRARDSLSLSVAAPLLSSPGAPSKNAPSTAAAACAHADTIEPGAAPPARENSYLFANQHVPAVDVDDLPLAERLKLRANW